MADNRSLERAIAGALRATINDHGPIDLAGIGSAVKRVVGNLANARFEKLAAAELGRARWRNRTPEEHRAVSSLGGRARWSKLTAKERSAEMKRRAAAREESLKKVLAHSARAEQRGDLAQPKVCARRERRGHSSATEP